jgi:hypothetical protein
VAQLTREPLRRFPERSDGRPQHAICAPSPVPALSPTAPSVASALPRSRRDLPFVPLVVVVALLLLVLTTPQVIIVSNLDHVLPVGNWSYPFSYPLRQDLPGCMKCVTDARRRMRPPHTRRVRGSLCTVGAAALSCAVSPFLHSVRRRRRRHRLQVHELVPLGRPRVELHRPPGETRAAERGVCVAEGGGTAGGPLPTD